MSCNLCPKSVMKGWAAPGTWDGIHLLHHASTRNVHARCQESAVLKKGVPAKVDGLGKSTVEMRSWDHGFTMFYHGLPICLPVINVGEVTCNMWAFLEAYASSTAQWTMIPWWWGDHPGIIEHFGRSYGFSVEMDGFPMDFPMDLLLGPFFFETQTTGPVELCHLRSRQFLPQRSLEVVQPWAIFVGISGNNWHNYWKWPFIVSFPIENGDFP